MIPTPETVNSAIDQVGKADAAVDALVETKFDRFALWRKSGDVRKRWIVGVTCFVLGAYASHVAHERGWFGLYDGETRTAVGTKP